MTRLKRLIRTMDPVFRIPKLAIRKIWEPHDPGGGGGGTKTTTR